MGEDTRPNICHVTIRATIPKTALDFEADFPHVRSLFVSAVTICAPDIE